MLDDNEKEKLEERAKQLGLMMPTNRAYYSFQQFILEQLGRKSKDNND